MREPSPISSRAGNVNMYVGLLMDVMLYYSPIESQGQGRRATESCYSTSRPASCAFDK